MRVIIAFLLSLTYFFSTLGVFAYLDVISPLRWSVLGLLLVQGMVIMFYLINEATDD